MPGQIQALVAIWKMDLIHGIIIFAESVVTPDLLRHILLSAHLFQSLPHRLPQNRLCQALSQRIDRQDAPLFFQPLMKLGRDQRQRIILMIRLSYKHIDQARLERFRQIRLIKPDQLNAAAGIRRSGPRDGQSSFSKRGRRI